MRRRHAVAGAWPFLSTRGAIGLEVFDTTVALPEQVANEVHVKEGNVDGSKGRASNSRMRHEASICIYLGSESTELLLVPRKFVQVGYTTGRINHQEATIWGWGRKKGDGERTQLSTKANGNARYVHRGYWSRLGWCGIHIEQ